MKKLAMLSVMTMALSSSFAFAEGYLTSEQSGQKVLNNYGECWLVQEEKGNLSSDCVEIKEEPVVQVEAPKPVPVQPKRLILDLSVLFDFDKSSLTQNGQEVLYKASQIIQDPRFIVGHIEVTGYTDRLGSASYNKTLSEKRASAVKDFFVSTGIPSAKIASYGEGKNNQVVDCKEKMSYGDLKECLKPNRRVEILIK